MYKFKKSKHVSFLLEQMSAVFLVGVLGQVLFAQESVKEYIRLGTKVVVIESSIPTTPPVSVSASPTTLQMRQQVTINANQSVNWTKTGGGTLSTAGPSTSTIFTAPQGTGAVGSVTVKGASIGDPSNFQNITLNIVAPTLTPGNVSPINSSGATGTFSFSGTSSAGVNSTNFYIYLGFSASNPMAATNGCILQFHPQTNILSLADNSGVYTQSGLIATNTSLSNSQCTVNLLGINKTVSGNTVTLNGVSISYSAAFLGLKYVFTNVYDAPYQAGYTLKGQWTVTSLPVSLSASPTTLQMRQQVTINANQSVNWTKTGGGTLSTAGPSTSTIFTAPQGTGAVGSVTVKGASIANPSNFQNITLNVVAPTLTPGNVSPIGGSGGSGTFSFSGTSSAGVNSANFYIYLGFSGSNPMNAANGCILQFHPQTNIMSLANNAGSYTQSGTIGTNVTLSNSQCTVNLLGTVKGISGNTATISGMSITFSGTFSGLKYVFTNVYDAPYQSYFTYKGTWTIP